METVTTISPVTRQEFASFMGLWADFLEENHKNGSEVLPSSRNLSVYANLVSACIYDPRRVGVALLAVRERPVGALLWTGVNNYPFETSWGRFAMGHGTYVVPELRQGGLSREIREAGVKALLEQGYETLIGASTDLKHGSAYHSAKNLGLRFHGVIATLRLSPGGE